MCLIVITLKNGFTLLELMLALALSAVMVFGYLALLLALNKNFQQQRLLSELQDNGRIATVFLRQQINQAGFSNCGKSLDMPIMGFAAKQVPSKYSINPVFGTDVLVVNHCELVQNLPLIKANIYFIGKTSYNTVALFLKTSGKRRQEIVPDVGNMSLRYAVNLGAGHVKYLPAKDIRYWSQVRHIQIQLSLNSKSQFNRSWIIYAGIKNNA